MKIVMLETLFLPLVTYSYTNVQSSSYFSKTKINPFTCDENEVNAFTMRSKWECMNSCTRDNRCRRLLYCSSDLSCRHFQFGADCMMSGSPTSCTCYKMNVACYGSSCTCPLGYHGNRCQLIVKDCKEAKTKANIYGDLAVVTIQPNFLAQPFDVVCSFRMKTGTVLLSRNEECGYENFNRSFVEYEQGFGSYYKNSWIGFHKLLAVMTALPLSYELEIKLKTDQGQCSAKYDNFDLGNTVLLYSFISTGYTSMGPGCGDSMLGFPSLLGRPFSTYDNDYTGANKCSVVYGGGWWFHNSPGCTKSFLTGTMNGSGIDNFWLDNYSGRKITDVLMTLTTK